MGDVAMCVPVVYSLAKKYSGLEIVFLSRKNFAPIFERLPQNVTGLTLLEGPGNDIVSTTDMTAAGANIILFSTGRGTPLGAPVPTIKIATNHPLAQRKKNWIDFDASAILSQESPFETRDSLTSLILQTADGDYRTKNEQNGYSEIAIMKEGVTL